MSRLIPLDNRQFGRLTVLRRDVSKPPRRVYWICQCECGAVSTVAGTDLTSRHTQSCGCLRTTPANELTNQRFGRWTVLQRDTTKVGEETWWICRCDCGIVRTVKRNSLTSKISRSCGCLQKEMAANLKRTHGKSYSPIAFVYYGIIRRCRNPKDPGFKSYGGRGISCEWQSLEEFCEDMEPSYKLGLSIERINNDGPYSKTNCRWATPREQGNNRRDNRCLTYQGETRTIAEWARCWGLDRGVLGVRLKSGWSIEKILTTPVRKHR